MTKKNAIKLCIATLSPFIVGCARCDQEFKGCASEFHGLDRDVVLYTATGQEMARWHTTATIDYRAAGDVSFLTSNGKRVHVSGYGIIVDQER